MLLVLLLQILVHQYEFSYWMKCVWVNFASVISCLMESFSKIRTLWSKWGRIRKRGMKRKSIWSVWLIWSTYQRCILRCGHVCAKHGLKQPTSLYPSAAEGFSGGAGRRQLRDQGLLIFGGSRGPRLIALRLPRWERWVGAPTMLSGLPSTVYTQRLHEDQKVWANHACNKFFTFSLLLLCL